MTNPELQESVLVVPSAIIAAACPQGFHRDAAGVKTAVLANCRFLERTVAEHDFGFKQVIPYVVVRHRDQFLLMRRTNKQTESRLHDKYSLGVGGHINSADVSNGQANVIDSGMRRELQEEIRVEAEQSCELIGIINDDSTEVARVHVGFVYLLNTASAEYTIMEPDKYSAAWKSAEEINQL